MSRAASSVKGGRPYDGSGRLERARAQHQLTLDRALGLFLEHGYVAVTVDTIAQAAGVSAATVFKSYGGKAGLVRTLCAQALAGTAAVPAEVRSDALRREVNPRAIVEGWGRLTAEVAPRIAPLLLLLRVAAQHDREASSLYEELDRARLVRMGENARALEAAGHLRAGVTVHEARDVMWTCSSPELYDLLVVARRWSGARYAGFVTETLVAALL